MDMYIAIDFDGTVVAHEYPKIGADIGAAPVLRDLVVAGHKLILWTMRSEQPLQDAVDWFSANGIELYGIQRNPTQDKWTSSLKCYAQFYIDDAALGAPLKLDKKISSRFFIDWTQARMMLEAWGLLKPLTQTDNGNQCKESLEDQS